MIPLQPVATLRDGHHRWAGARFQFFITLIFLCTTLPAHAAVDLAEISRLAKGGASQLALSLISQHQPNHEKSLADWQRWERVRVRIMEEHGQWGALAAHIAIYPQGLPEEFRQWGEQHRAAALIEAGDYDASRAVLRGEIWGAAIREAAVGERLAQLRRLVMESYLEEGRIQDAYAAMLRYQQDYGEQDGNALLLRAKVLLAAGRPDEARALLRRLQTNGVVEALRALAAVRSGEALGEQLKLARNASVEAAEDGRLRWLWLGVMAEAAERLNDSANLIIALERMLPLERQMSVGSSERRLFALSPEQLWQGYHGYAERLGNQEQLLLGDDTAWLAAAEKTESRYPVRRRSLLVMLATRGSSREMRERGHQALVEQFDELGEEGVILLRRLYLESGRYQGEERLPQAVGYRLVDEALKGGELGLASTLLQQLPEPPGGTERFAWQLRRAKVFLLAGDYAEADGLLTALMPAAAVLLEGQRDQVVQLLFDLQAVGEHERAYRLFSSMYDEVPSAELRRELLFWMADSRKAQALHTEAARLYLQSAALMDNNSMDPWAQTARYQAAKSLTDAGLVDDAAFIYRQLLKITESPERRSVLRHELQQLRLQGEKG